MLTLKIGATRKKNIYVFNKSMVVTCADGCCGVGGFSQAIKIVFGSDAVRTVWARDIDPIAAAVFQANHTLPIDDSSACGSLDRLPLPPCGVDFMTAGLPCQSYSKIGNNAGHSDERGGDVYSQFIEVVRYSKPRCILIENVPDYLTRHSGDRQFDRLRALGYTVFAGVLCAEEWGHAQRRHRMYAVCIADGSVADHFVYPTPCPELYKPVLRDILELPLDDRPAEYHATAYTQGRRRDVMRDQCVRMKRAWPGEFRSWHSNKVGYLTSANVAYALRASASAGYQLIDGKFNFTSGELLKLQGFPSNYDLAPAKNRTAVKRLMGNSIAINCAIACIEAYKLAKQNAEHTTPSSENPRRRE